MKTQAPNFFFPIGHQEYATSMSEGRLQVAMKNITVGELQKQAEETARFLEYSWMQLNAKKLHSVRERQSNARWSWNKATWDSVERQIIEVQGRVFLMHIRTRRFVTEHKGLFGRTFYTPTDQYDPRREIWATQDQAQMTRQERRIAQASVPQFVEH